MAANVPLWRPGEPERLAFWLQHLPDGAWLIAFHDDPATSLTSIQALLQAATGLSIYSFNLAPDPEALLAALPALPADGRVVISCSGLGQATWPALNRLRQVWPEYPHLLLLWLSMAERDLILQHQAAIWTASSAYFDFLIPGPAGYPDPRPRSPLSFNDRAAWKSAVRLRHKWLEAQHASGDAPPALLTDLYSQLIRLYYAVGEHRQGEVIARTHLTESEQLNYLPGQAAALHDLGTARCKQGDRQMAQALYEQALALWQEIKMPAGEATTLAHLGLLSLRQGDWSAAETMLQQALGRYRQIGDRAGEGNILNNLGELHERSGDQVRALALFQRALSIRREVQDRAGEARTLGNIGNIYQVRGNPERAQEMFSSALAIHQELDNRAGEARLLLSLGAMAEQLQQPQQAIGHYQRAQQLWQDLGYRRQEARALERLAAVNETQGNRETALELYKKAAVIRQELRP